MVSPELRASYQTLIFLAGSASAEVFADVALCPFEAVKARRPPAHPPAAFHCNAPQRSACSALEAPGSQKPTAPKDNPTTAKKTHEPIRLTPRPPPKP